MTIIIQSKEHPNESKTQKNRNKLQFLSKFVHLPKLSRVETPSYFRY